MRMYLMILAASAVFVACGASPPQAVPSFVSQPIPPACAVNKDGSISKPGPGTACVWESDTRGGQVTFLLVFAEGERPEADRFDSLPPGWLSMRFDLTDEWERRIRLAEGNPMRPGRRGYQDCDNFDALSPQAAVVMGTDDALAMTCNLRGAKDRRVPVCLWGERQGAYCLLAEDAEPFEVNRPEQDRALRVLVSLHQDPIEENVAFGVLGHLNEMMPSVNYEPACRVENTFYSISVRERHDASVMLVFCSFGDDGLLVRSRPEAPVDDDLVRPSTAGHLGSGKSAVE